MRFGKTTNNVLPTTGAPRGRTRTITLWVLQVVLAFLFVGGGWLKVTGATEMVDMFDEIGIGQWFRFVVGALELAGAIGLLIPRLAGLAALGLCCVLVGAIFTNLFVIDEAPWTPLGMLVASAAIVWGRWPEINALIRTRGI